MKWIRSPKPQSLLNCSLHWFKAPFTRIQISGFVWTLPYFLRVKRAIFVWLWNENARTKQKQTNGNREIWLVYRTDTNAPGFWKKLHARELSRNQSILRFDVILQHDWPIEQWLLHIRVFFGGKTKSPWFDVFIHWLIKQMTNTYRNHFSRLYENRSNARFRQCTSMSWIEFHILSS